MSGIAGEPPKMRCPKCEAMTRPVCVGMSDTRGPSGEFYLLAELECGCTLEPDGEEIVRRFLEMEKAWVWQQQSTHRHTVDEAIRRCPCYYCRREVSGNPKDGSILDGNGELKKAPRGGEPLPPGKHDVPASMECQ